MLTVLPDTNILLSIRLLDLVMRSHAFGLFEVVWSDELVDEYRRKLIDVRGRTSEQAAAAAQRFMDAAHEGRIEPREYLHLIPGMLGKDSDDHVISAAARGGGVHVVLTGNISDFPASDIGPGCEALTAAQLFGRLAADFPQDLAAIVRLSSANLTRPPLSPEEILDRLAAVGLTEMATSVRPLL